MNARVCIFALAVCLIGCVDPCENRVLWEVAGPSENRAAIVFERSCGATTGVSRQVSVVKGFGKRGKSAGNVFAADSDHGAVPDMAVTVRWTAPDQLVIRYPAQARVFRQESRVDGVRIAYEAAR